LTPYLAGATLIALREGAANMLAAGPFGLGFPELIIILVVVLLIFGASRLADVGGALGSSIREFRKAAKEPEEEEAASSNASIAAPAEQPRAERHCTSCGATIEGEHKFCANCGAPVQAGVN
jgi:sec-independent protein translocase protein TatA